MKFLFKIIFLFPSLVFSKAPEIIKDIFYTDAKKSEQALDLYLNPNVKSSLLIYVHGGAWVSGDKSEYEELAKNFQNEIHVAVVNYRLAPTFPHPADTDDVKAAIKFLLAEKRITPQKIYLMGHSAGAYIVAFLATQLQEPKVAGYIGLSGIYDLPILADKWPGYPDWFLKKEFGKDIASDAPTSWKNNSPARMKIVSKAPWLLLHSSADELVDMGQSEIFNKHLQSEKLESQLLILKKLPHFGIVSELSQEKSKATKEVLKFLGAKATKL